MSHAANLPLLHEHDDYTGNKIGMWLFLFTEVLLFGGMFILYAVYRSNHFEEFHHAAGHLDSFVGAMNTLILLTSSLTMAVSIAACHKGHKRMALVMLGITILCGFLFMYNKYFEWGHKFELGIYPNSATLSQTHSPGEVLFYGLYFVMTGLHGLHVLVGMVLLSIMFWAILKKPNEHHRFEVFRSNAMHGKKVAILDENGKPLWTSNSIDESVKMVDVNVYYLADKKKAHPREYVALENSGLYWHLVDVIWIFLFPLFYLIG